MFPWYGIDKKDTERCSYCESSDIEVDRSMESHNSDLGKTYYRCNRCKKEFTLNGN